MFLPLSFLFSESTSGVFFNCSFKTSNTELLLGSNFLAFFSFSNALELGSSLEGLQKIEMRSCELDNCLDVCYNVTELLTLWQWFRTPFHPLRRQSTDYGGCCTWEFSPGYFSHFRVSQIVN